jgi:hypothetical protein
MIEDKPHIHFKRNVWRVENVSYAQLWKVNEAVYFVMTLNGEIECQN